jgi:hypothetical protein
MAAPENARSVLETIAESYPGIPYEAGETIPDTDEPTNRRRAREALAELGPFPLLHGYVATERWMALRQHAGDGRLGDAEIELTTTGGLGGFALVVEVKPQDGDTVYVIYNLAPLVEDIAGAVLKGLGDGTLAA